MCVRLPPSDSCRLHLIPHFFFSPQIEMEAAIRELDRLQVGLEIPPIRHEPVPAGFLRQARIRFVCVVGRGGIESELRTVRCDARHR